MADLFIGYQAAVSTEQQFTAYSTGWGYGPGWYGGGWYGPSGGITSGQTSTIYKGQLAVDMYDAAKHELVWRGVASKTLDPKAKPEKTGEESQQSRRKTDEELSASSKKVT